MYGTRRKNDTATTTCVLRSARADWMRRPVKRQTMARLLPAWIAQSRPQPIKATELAAMPAAIPTVPSITNQATVSHDKNSTQRTEVIRSVVSRSDSIAATPDSIKKS